MAKFPPKPRPRAKRKEKNPTQTKPPSAINQPPLTVSTAETEGVETSSSSLPHEESQEFTSEVSTESLSRRNATKAKSDAKPAEDTSAQGFKPGAASASSLPIHESIGVAMAKARRKRKAAERSSIDAVAAPVLKKTRRTGSQTEPGQPLTKEPPNYQKLPE